jgi:two-component system cell cycle response regulator
MQALIHKIMTLDMTLAIETYHWSKVREMEMSISDLRSREHVLLNKAQTDSLTGLMNRAYLSEMLQQTLKTATRHERISAMMLDIDFFKTINDSYGHQTGDDVLVEVGRRMQRAVRDRDDVARYGGEEFFILLRNIDFARARVIAERLRRLISDHPFHIQGLQIDVTLSIGLTYLRREDSAESFIARADKALYDAKHQGRNCVVVKE